MDKTSVMTTYHWAITVIYSPSCHATYTGTIDDAAGTSRTAVFQQIRDETAHRTGEDGAVLFFSLEPEHL